MELEVLEEGIEQKVLSIGHFAYRQHFLHCYNSSGSAHLCDEYCASSCYPILVSSFPAKHLL